MNCPDETNREIQALRGRISALSAAILRISASLDLDTGLQEVVDSARAFTDEDEEVLMLFASQAAAAIANARTHRDEQRARADLEALIDTSPVGVVVFDARTGQPVSLNREANRIVEPL